MGKYYKIPPEWAQKINVAGTAPRHPDGWYLIIHTKARKLAGLLAPREDGEPWGEEEAVRAVGGCVYTLEEALASQRGERAYRMDLPPLEENAETGLYNPDGTEYKGEVESDGKEGAD